MENWIRVNSVETAMVREGEGEDVYDNEALERLISRSVDHTLLDGRSLLMNEVCAPR